MRDNANEKSGTDQGNRSSLRIPKGDLFSNLSAIEEEMQSSLIKQETIMLRQGTYKHKLSRLASLEEDNHYG